jgi:hypothetical protein
MANEWGRGTTPEITIHVDADLTDANVYLTFVQDGRTVLELDETQMTVTADSIVVPLNQENTMRMKVGDISMQIRYVAADGSSGISNEMFTKIIKTYKNGVLSYVERASSN